MTSAPTYRVDQAYQPFLHRELSVSWLLLSTLLAGRHRLELPGDRFDYLEFGCGYGLNLLFNAAAHPQSHFYGIDLYAGHVAEAQSWARQLGLTNVSFAVEDLRNFVDGPTRQGPCRDWPTQYTFIVAHGVATWVGEAERGDLIRSAANLLIPGGLFYCSYNTFPGWLARNTLNMLSLEYGRLQGNNTSKDSILKAVTSLESLLWSDEQSLPLGREFPQLGDTIKELRAKPADYLSGEYHASHQPVYVSELHGLCARQGLTHAGTASLSEQFPELLDPERRAVIEQVDDATLQAALFDLAICQSFRRDLFVKGVRRPTKAWLKQSLSSLSLHALSPNLAGCNTFKTTLGTLEIEPQFVQTLDMFLTRGGQLLGDLKATLGWEFDDILPRLALLIDQGWIGVGNLPGLGDRASCEQVEAFNLQALSLITSGHPLGGLLSSSLLVPVPLESLDAFFVQVLIQGFREEAAANLVWMGLLMAGMKLNDSSGEAVVDDHEAVSRLTDYWTEFETIKLAPLRSWGVIG